MIKGLSDKRRLPRMGKIKLGVMAKKGEKTYPTEVDYFVCPEIVQKTYGPQPKELIIVFPMEDEEKFFQQFYMKYGNGVLQCKGDGEIGTYFDFDEMEFLTKKCPCEFLEKGKCKAVGRLQFMLPEVEEAAGVWQIDTSSKNSIIDINSGIDYIRGICGRISMIPIKLIRSEIETQRMDKKDKKMKKGKHFTMKFSLEGVTLKALQLYGQTSPTRFFLPEPDPNQPEDLFPPNGFAPDEKEDLNDDQRDQAAQDIADMQMSEEEMKAAQKEAFRTVPLALSDGTKKMVTKFEAYKYFGKIREAIGDEVYYGVIGDYGYEHCNQLPNNKLPKAYAELLTKYEDAKTDPE